MSKIFKKLKEIKNSVRTHSPSRPTTAQQSPPIHQPTSLLDAPLATYVLHTNTTTLHHVGPASSTDQLSAWSPSTSSLSPPALSATVPELSSVPTVVHDQAILTTLTPVVSTSSSAERPLSRRMIIVADVLKNSLVLLNAALAGVPLPFKGAFTVAIEIIKIAEVK
jgi:hypothetical protein